MVIYRHRDQYSISEMCRFFNVSRSGYYDYVKRMDVPDRDLPLAEKIRECQEKCGKTYGYRRVQIWLEQNVNLVLNAIRAAKRKEKVTAELQLHSDQSFQYTSPGYYRLTQSYGITPSMSRRGNPYDNASAENFFSILKTECFYRVKLQTFAEVRRLIDEYIHIKKTIQVDGSVKLSYMFFQEYHFRFYEILYFIHGRPPVS